MEMSDTIDDREADTHTLILLIATLINTIEFLLHIVDLRLRDTDTIISEGEDIGFFRPLEATDEVRSCSSVLDEVREDIVDDLDTHIAIHADHRFTTEVERDRLLVLLDLWHIGSDEVFEDMLQREPLDIDCRIGLAHHALIFHDLSRDLSQTSEFTLEESDRPGVKLQNTVLDPIEVALHRRDRSTDLM